MFNLIELTTNEGNPIFVNPSHIVFVRTRDGIHSIETTIREIEVKESPMEIKQLIRDEAVTPTSDQDY